MILAELKELALKASPGPWKLEFRRLIGPKIYRDCGDKIQMAYSDDAAYIAAANPQTVLKLIERIEKLRSGYLNIIDMDDHGLRKCIENCYCPTCISKQTLAADSGVDVDLEGM